MPYNFDFCCCCWTSVKVRALIGNYIPQKMMQLLIHALNGINPCQWNGSQIHLTHWGRVTHICVSKLIIIGSDNALSPGRRQAIIWTNNCILLIWTPRNKFQWNRNRNSYAFIQENALENVVRKMASILSQPQCVKMLTPFLCMACS